MSDDKHVASLQDFYLMMRCKQFIFGHSTYAWWAAMMSSDYNTTKLKLFSRPSTLLTGCKEKKWQIHGESYYRFRHLFVFLFHSNQLFRLFSISYHLDSRLESTSRYSSRSRSRSHSPKRCDRSADRSAIAHRSGRLIYRSNREPNET